MTLRRLGTRTVFPIGVAPVPSAGAALVSQRDEMYDTVAAALDAGVTLIDAGRLGGSPRGGADSIIAEALAAWTGPAGSRGRVVVAGHVGLPDTGMPFDEVEGAVRDAAERLGQPLGLCLVHRANDSAGWSGLGAALDRLATTGAVAALGVADVAAAALASILGRDTPAVAVVAVEQQFGPGFDRDAGLLQQCSAAGIAWLPRVSASASQEAHEPESPFESLGTIAEQRSLSVSQLTLAWLLAKADVVVPVVACAHAAEIEAAVHAADIELTHVQYAQLDAAIPEGLTVFDEPPASS